MTHPERTLVDARERTAPERIYLQDGCDSPECDGDTCGLSHYDGEMTWCADRINPNDTEYVRADLMRAALERVEALEEAAFGMLGYAQHKHSCRVFETVSSCTCGYSDAYVAFKVAVRGAKGGGNVPSV